MRSFLSRLLLLVAMVLLVAGRGSRVTSEAAEADDQQELRVVFLRGGPDELGWQHAQQLGNTVSQSVEQVLGYFRRALRLPVLGAWVVNWWLDRSWSQSWPSIPAEYAEELRALSGRSGVPLQELWRLHAVPDRTYSCSNFAVWGRASTDGRMIHVRNLDWSIAVRVQRHPVVFVVRPAGKLAYVSVGWSGFIGVLTGVNARQISIGQVGAKSVDVTFRGLPMTFLMRRVLEEAQSLEEAVHIIARSPRTVGVNYIIADAKARRAIAVETTSHFVQVFEADDPKEHAVSYARPIPDAVFRADPAMDPVIRHGQVASGGDPKRSGIQPPTGSAYDIRYLGQAAGILASYGRLDVERVKQIARTIAPDSNVQSAIIAWPELWVANAEERTPAVRRPYHRFNLDELLAQGGP